jgi:phytanoyl-CoA hydroxylase
MSAETNKSKMLERYEADGFLAFRGFLIGTELNKLLSNVDRLLSEMVTNLPREHVFYEDRNDPATLKQIQHLEEHDAWFDGLLTAGLFRELAESLLGGPVVPKNMQYFNKPPGIGLPTPPHQDGYYFMLDPCEALTMWFASPISKDSLTN